MIVLSGEHIILYGIIFCKILLAKYTKNWKSISSRGTIKCGKTNEKKNKLYPFWHTCFAPSNLKCSWGHALSKAFFLPSSMIKMIILLSFGVKYLLYLDSLLRLELISGLGFIFYFLFLSEEGWNHWDKALSLPSFISIYQLPTYVRFKSFMIF